MTQISRPIRAAFAAGALTLSLTACAYTGAPMTGADCFSSTQWRGWSSPVDDVIYLKVGTKDVWRVDLVPGSGRNLDRGGDFLISEVRGSSRICTANDLDIAIGTSTGFRTPLFPRTLRKLTPQEAAALPPAHRP
jgi:hypothetical protein